MFVCVWKSLLIDHYWFDIHVEGICQPNRSIIGYDSSLITEDKAIRAPAQQQQHTVNMP